MEHRAYIHHRRVNPKRESRISIPDRVGPHVKLVFSEMRRQKVTYDVLEEHSGVLRTTLKAWRKRNRPGLETLEAVLGFLGFDFVPVPRARTLPPEVLAELQPIADRLGLEMPALSEATVEIASGIRERVPTQAAPAFDPTPAEVADVCQKESGLPCAA